MEIMDDSEHLGATGRLFGEVIVLRSVVGALAAVVGDLTGDRAAFLRSLLEACSQNIECMSIKDSDSGRAEDIKIHAHGALEQTIGILRGAQTPLTLISIGCAQISDHTT